MRAGRRWAVVGAVAAATLGVYFLVGASWAAREGWEFAGKARPVLGLALLGAATLLLYLDARARKESARTPPRATIVLYTRETCTLCDEARAVVGVLAEEAGYAVWEQDVDDDPALATTWGDHVPVATLGDEVLFTLRADAGKLRARLAAARKT